MSTKAVNLQSHLSNVFIFRARFSDWSISSVKDLFFALMVHTTSAAPRGAACGSDRYVSGGAGNNMDAKVNGCPSGQSWEPCCAACGSALQASRALQSVGIA
ncbi:hypothetical protein RvY_02698 [Ramazzottius varieornatus]|uniref:Uncharacterized protein n=1 Tax=Ramazzottius varieornatus TaxID=947166 RepID=A0A1D1ULE6_RAMVA|nr:hypothetical protein RvY_02698 [Ramazzottius varieornatus]